MPSETLRQARTRFIARETAALDRKIAALQVISSRVSWLRVVAFAGGILTAFAIGSRAGMLAGGLALATGIVVFVAAVVYHLHFERWIHAYEIVREMRADQLARMDLDWDKMRLSLSIRGKSPISLDLDLTGPQSLHQLLDTTISRQGSQLIADWLTATVPDVEEVHHRQNIVRELVPLNRFRTRFWLTFRLVMQEQLEAENLLYWLAVKFPSARLWRILPFAAALAFLNIVLFVLYFRMGGLPFWILSLAAYSGLYFHEKEALDTVFHAIVRMDTELDRFRAIVGYLEKFDYQGHSSLAELCAPFRDTLHSPSSQMRKIKLATIGVGLRSNPYTALILNLLLPWDFAFALLSDHFRNQVAQTFPVWVQVCYQLDALIAVANLAYLFPEYTFPKIELGLRPVLEAQGLGHPLIRHDRQTRNDFSVQVPGEVAIITGSNMAGKSTFIKAVGINLCLANTGAPVNAQMFCSVPFRLHTCVRITDSIVDGFSYFYAEVKCLKKLLEELNEASSLPLLYLIDEIFRGTNNRERLVGSRAYIRAVMGKNGDGLLATHDLELASLANQSPLIHNYHFRDMVADGKLMFDYKIRPGPSPTTNALKIMQMEGLPVEEPIGKE